MPTSTTNAATATTTLVTTSTSTANASPPPTTVAPSLGGYSVTPVRSDGQRVTFRLTVPDGAVAEVSFSPPDATIMLIEPSIGLLPPNGPAAGGGIFTASAESGVFASICATVLGGNCTPKSTEPLPDGARVEEFTRADGGVFIRVVFGPWAMTVRDREIAKAFAFHGGPDGFPIVSALSAGYATKDPYLQIYMTDGRRYLLRSDASATCTDAAVSPSRCDRGLTIIGMGQSDDVTVVRRVG
jgi:hypothetical protein